MYLMLAMFHEASLPGVCGCFFPTMSPVSLIGTQKHAKTQNVRWRKWRAPSTTVRPAVANEKVRKQVIVRHDNLQSSNLNRGFFSRTPEMLHFLHQGSKASSLNVSWHTLRDNMSLCHPRATKTEDIQYTLPGCHGYSSVEITCTIHKDNN